MGNLRPFQIALLAFFAFLAIGSVVMLSIYQASVSQQSKIYGDKVVVWGTLEADPMNRLFQDIRDDIEAFQVVQYRPMDEGSFIDDLVNAIAEGKGPDLIILSSEQMVTMRSKLNPIPYETLPLRTIKDTYVDGVEIFTFPEGLYAVPMAVDPLMLYWNRDLFAAAGLAVPPKTWEDVINLVVPDITVVDTQRTIRQSAIAFGEFRNLINPKAILMTLAMQSGSRMVYVAADEYSVEIDRHIDIESQTRPMQTAMEFFTNFSNANSPLYTWNRVQTDDKNAFLAGELAMYFGLASEYQDITSKNPNLNFDVTQVPQGSTATIRRTYADFYGLAIPQSSRNAAGAYQAALTLTSPAYGVTLATQQGMVSPRRDVIATGAADPVVQSVMNAALFARGWLDPNPVQTNTILQEMVESVVSNRERVNRAVEQAVGRIAKEF